MSQDVLSIVNTNLQENVLFKRYIIVAFSGFRLLHRALELSPFVVFVVLLSPRGGMNLWDRCGACHLLRKKQIIDIS